MMLKLSTILFLVAVFVELAPAFSDSEELHPSLYGEELAEPATSKCDSDCEALLEAAAAGDVEKVQTLLDGGVDVNSTSPTGDTAAMVAAIEKKVLVVVLLIAYGADVNLKGIDGLTPLMAATVKGDRPTMAVLLAADGIKVDVQNNIGNTALILACKTRNADAVHLLLEAGASKDIKNKKGQTALDVAKMSKDQDVIALLNAGSSKLTGKEIGIIVGCILGGLVVVAIIVIVAIICCRKRKQDTRHTPFISNPSA